jgi:serine protease Do
MTPRWRTILTAVAAFAAGGGVLWMVQHRNGPAEQAPDSFTPEARPRVDLGQMPLWAALNEEQSLAVERVMPGVVSIQVQRRVMKKEPVLKGGKIEEVEREVIEPGVGSGAIVSKEGHIVTNWHVVEGGTDAIFVTLAGEETARHAALVDKDDQIDIALLRVEVRRKGEEFTALRFGDSDKVKRGHLVLAMGSPFNLRETVTNGIISHRERRVSDTLTAYLQTTCTINPGNSGGPLVNLEGDIIGIVTRKLLGPDEQASAEGYGLAIPGNDVFEAVDRLRSKGRPRIYLGLQVGDWPEGNWQRGQPGEAVMVTGVWKLSPAEKAGLKLGDIIESVNGTRVTNGAEYRRATRGHKVGDTMKFTVRRDGAATELSAVLEDFDKAVPPESTVPPATVRGVTVRVLRRSERNLLQLTEPVGLAVEAVTEDSPFAGLLRRGMNVLHVSSPDRATVKSVATPAELAAELDALAATGGLLVTAATGERDRWMSFPPLN